MRVRRPTPGKPGLFHLVDLLPCDAKGKPTGDYRPCGTCTGKKRVPLVACGRFGVASEDDLVVDADGKPVACCATCPHRSLAVPAKFPAPGLRHLVYHVYPVTGNGVWQENVRQLVERWPLFTGRKFVAVMAGKAKHTLDTVEAVRAAFPPDAEVIEVPNVAAVREVSSWAGQWRRALDVAGDDDAILYAHAKAVTRGEPHYLEWAKVLYETCLDHWPLVEQRLRSFPIVGSFKKIDYRVSGMVLPFHFTGTFFWVRAGVMRTKNWDHVTPDWWGERLWPGWANEAWMGTAFRASEAGVIYREFAASEATRLGLPHVWAKEFELYREWRAANPPLRPWAPDWAPHALPVPTRAPDRVAKLHVVTPCTRPANLGRIAESLTPLRERFDLRWHVVHSRGDRRDQWGYPERNELLDEIADGWVWFLDDDTVAAPGTAETFAAAIAANPEVAALVFAQVRKDGSLRLPPNADATVGQIDTGSFVIRRAALEGMRFPVRHQGDGHFWEAFRAAHPGPEVVAVDRVGSVYNALR